MKATEVLDDLRRRFPNEPEYLQAVEEVITTIEDAYNEHPEFDRYNLIERLCIPDRIFSFRVSWIDDKGRVQNNMGYRIQHNNAIGPYKGGIRFHSSVNLSILKFLAFEQTFKNSLTTLAMGGAKGGSDFSPRGKSDMEVMRFCQAFIAELWRQIGPDTDVPAGDIGVGGREVGYMYGMYKKMALENMGSQINTPGNEMFPYSRTDSLLYFSSDGHPGFGGLDIFRAKLNTTGDFWSVDNMGQPVNSQGDDFGITFGPGESGFFSSNRGDAKGYDHIFSFELPDIRITISGWVLDKDEEPVPNAIIRIVGDDGSNQKEVARDDGSFKFNLDRGVKYVMKAGAPGYLNVKQEFESDSAEEDADYGVDFILAAINKPQVVENIFYDFDKATLRDESKAALDEMAQMLRENPHVTIEMGAHTDRKGSDEYNVRLSERRAQSVVDYLIGAGIAADRLSPKGYGESVPKTVTKRINREYPQFPEGTVLTEEFIETLSPEDQEAADQINRRTEFQVLSIDYDMF